MLRTKKNFLMHWKREPMFRDKHWNQAIMNWWTRLCLISSEHAKSKCTIISFQDSRKSSYFFDNELNTENFRLQMAGYDAGRKEIIYHSRLFPGSRNLSHQRWLMRGRKRPFQLFCQTMTWKTFTTRMNSDFFISAFQIKLTSWSQKSAMGKAKWNPYYWHGSGKCYVR